MKKIGIGMFCIALCLAVTLIFPYVGRTYIDAYDASEWELSDDFLTHPPDGLVDDALCLTCHDAGGPGDPEPTLHGIHGSGAAGCMDCHTDSTGLGTVFSSSCVVCHPSGDEGTCQLVDLHDPGFGADCLGCHTECVEETTTTTTAEETTTTTTAEETTTTTTAEETTTTTTAEETTTTTTAEVTTTTSIGDASITVTPLFGDSLLRSRWAMLLEFLIIRGVGTNFEHFPQTDVVYSPDGQVLSISALVLTKTLIIDPIIVLPVFLADGSEDVTLTVTVDGLSDDVEISVP